MGGGGGITQVKHDKFELFGDFNIETSDFLISYLLIGHKTVPVMMTQSETMTPIRIKVCTLLQSTWLNEADVYTKWLSLTDCLWRRLLKYKDKTSDYDNHKKQKRNVIWPNARRNKPIYYHSSSTFFFLSHLSSWLQRRYSHVTRSHSPALGRIQCTFCIVPMPPEAHGEDVTSLLAYRLMMTPH